VDFQLSGNSGGCRFAAPSISAATSTSIDASEARLAERDAVDLDESRAAAGAASSRPSYFKVQ
jgi:hypothetical protein